MFVVRSRWLSAACALAALLVTTAAQAQQFKLLPSDTEMVVTINLVQILKSDLATSNREILDLVKAKISDQLEDKGADKYLKKAGFDIFRDLNSITIGVPGGRPPAQGFIILDGRFDADKFEAAAIDAGNDNGDVIKVVRIAGVKAFEINVEEQTAYVAVLGKKTMIAASAKTDFVAAVQAFNGESKGKLKKEVKTLLDLLNAKQSISIVATANVLNKLAENAPQDNNQAKTALEIMKQLEGVSIGIAIQKNIDFQFGLSTKDNKTASGFADLSNLFITGARAKVKKQAEENEKFAPAVEILSSLRATAQGSNLLIRGQIGFASLGKILANLPLGNN